MCTLLKGVYVCMRVCECVYVWRKQRLSKRVRALRGSTRTCGTWFLPSSSSTVVPRDTNFFMLKQHGACTHVNVDVHMYMYKGALWAPLKKGRALFVQRTCGTRFFSSSSSIVVHLETGAATTGAGAAATPPSSFPPPPPCASALAPPSPSSFTAPASAPPGAKRGPEPALAPGSWAGWLGWAGCVASVGRLLGAGAAPACSVV